MHTAESVKDTLTIIHIRFNNTINKYSPTTKRGFWENSFLLFFPPRNCHASDQIIWLTNPLYYDTRDNIHRTRMVYKVNNLNTAVKWVSYSTPKINLQS